jgi:hypothetical protein
MEQANSLAQMLRELCLEIATGDIASERFTRLLYETGIQLDDHEWDAANRVLSQSECMISSYPAAEMVQH